MGVFFPVAVRYPPSIALGGSYSATREAIPNTGKEQLSIPICVLPFIGSHVVQCLLFNLCELLQVHATVAYDARSIATKKPVWDSEIPTYASAEVFSSDKML